MANILIVDDDRSLTHLMKSVLLEEGYDVTLANSVNQAMEEIYNKKPDLILMDVVMPERGGAEAVRIFQKNPELMNIPVVFLTALITGEEDDLEEKGIHINGQVYQTLGKPFDMNELLKVIKDTLKG